MSADGRRGANAILTRRRRHAAMPKGYAYAAGRVDWFLGLMAMGQGRIRRRARAITKKRSTPSANGRCRASRRRAQPAGGAARLSRRHGNRLAAPGHRVSKSLSVSRSLRFKSQLLASAVPVNPLGEPGNCACRSRRRRWLSLVKADVRPRLPTPWRSVPRYSRGLNRAAEAEAGIREAREHLARIARSSVQSRVEVDGAATESDLKRRSDPEAAVAAATQAINWCSNGVIACASRS